MESYFETNSFKYEDENFKMKTGPREQSPPQDLLVYDSMSHLVPILSDLTLPAARFFTSPAQNNPMGISSGFAPARENSLTQAKACQNTSPRQIIGNLSIPYRLVAGSQQ